MPGGLHIANDLRLDVLDRLQRQSLRFHGTHRVGDLTARVTSDVAYTQDMLVQLLSTLLPSSVLILGMFGVMLALDPVFTLLALLVTPALIWGSHRTRQRLRTAARQVRKSDGQLAAAATENLSSIHLVQAFTLEEDRMRRFAGLSSDNLAAGLESVRVQSRFGPLVEFGSVVSTAVVLWFGALRVLDGRLHPRRAAGVPGLPRLALQADQVPGQAVYRGQQGRRGGGADPRRPRHPGRHRRPAGCSGGCAARRRRTAQRHLLLRS